MFDMRSYGDFHGLSEADYQAVKDDIPHPQVRYENGVLSVDHEGEFLFVDDFLERMAELLGPDGWGKLDVIDHVDWTMTRYVIENGSITSHDISLNEVLEPCKSGDDGKG